MTERGEITKDLPYLDEACRSEIESILNVTKNYWDFGEKLSNKAVDLNYHPNLVYLSLYHVSRLKNAKAVNEILDAHPDFPIPFPFYYPEGNDHDYDKEIIERAIELNQNPMITFYMLMRLFFFDFIVHPS